MKDKNTGLVKIGSSSDISVRIQTLSCGNPYLSILAVLDKNIEKELHLKFADKKIKGEFYNLTNEDVSHIIKKYGFGDFFGHGLGHGVGLEIHEEPYLSFRGSHVLKENMTVTIEPGVYLPNKFGVRIEDLVFMTSTGIKNVTGSSKELITI